MIGKGDKNRFRLRKVLKRFLTPFLSPGGDLRHHAAEARVQVGLRGDDVGENPWLIGEDGSGGFIAGCFQSEKVGHNCLHTIGRLQYSHDDRAITTVVFRQAV